MSKVLVMESVSVTFGGVNALSHVTFGFPDEHNILGIIGPNGAGKSTLLSVIAGYVRPSRGTLTVFEQVQSGYSPQKASALGIGRTFQVPRPFSQMSVYDNLVVSGLSKLGMRDAKARAKQVLDQLELGPYASRLPGEMNLASRKRLEIGKAMVTNPRLMLLDEIFEGASESDVAWLSDMLVRYSRESGVKLILVEHIIRAVRNVCPWLIVLNYGRVLSQGVTKEVLESEEVVTSYLGQRRGGGHA